MYPLVSGYKLLVRDTSTTCVWCKRGFTLNQEVTVDSPPNNATVSLNLQPFTIHFSGNVNSRDVKVRDRNETERFETLATETTSLLNSVY